MNTKIEVLWIFWQFWAAKHISRANCTENNRDGQGEATYEIFGTELRF